LIRVGRCEPARQAMRASTPGSPYSPPDLSVITTLDSPPATVVDGNANAMGKLIHVVERLALKMDDLQTEVRVLRAHSHGTENGRPSAPFLGDLLHAPGVRREPWSACHCDWRVWLQVYRWGLPDGRPHVGPFSTVQTTAKIQHQGMVSMRKNND